MQFFSLELRGGRIPLAKKHVRRLLAFAPAFFDVECEVVLQNIVAFGIAEFGGGSVDCRGRPFEFDKRADGSLVQLNEETAGPGRGRGKAKSSTELLITEPSAHSEALENSR